MLHETYPQSWNVVSWESWAEGDEIHVTEFMLCPHQDLSTLVNYPTSLRHVDRFLSFVSEKNMILVNIGVQVEVAKEQEGNQR